MNLPSLSRYTGSGIASGFGVAFLVAAPRFGQATHEAPTGALLEAVYGIPAVTFSIVGIGLLIFAAVYAVVQSISRR